MRVLKDRIASNADDVMVLLPTNWKGDGTVPAVIGCHGRDGGSVEEWAFGQDAFTRRIVDAGLPIFWADLKGPRTYGNDTAITAVGVVAAWAQSQYGCKAGKVVLWTNSMGNTAGCNWARTNKASVLGIVAMIPMCDLDYLHDNPSSVVPTGPAEAEAAYGGSAGYEAALPTHNPAAYAVSSAMGDLPHHIFYNTNDQLAVPVQITPYAAAVNAVLHPAISTDPNGHGWSGFDPEAVVRAMAGMLP